MFQTLSSLPEGSTKSTFRLPPLGLNISLPEESLTTNDNALVPVPGPKPGVQVNETESLLVTVLNSDPL